jgi:putative glycosyl hydrolase
VRKRLVLPLLIVLGLLAVPAVGQAYLTGVADQSAKMFSNSYYTRLIARQPSSQRVSRYILGYDAADGTRGNSFFLDQFRLWYAAAQKSHVQILVAFNHSQLRSRYLKIPSTSTYAADVKKIMQLFPGVAAWQPWNEANRGLVPGVENNPSASGAANFYKADLSVCAQLHRQCTIVALDVVDQNNVSPTLRYISQFKSAVRRLHLATPRLWGLHNYSDTNRRSSARTRAVLNSVPGQVWLTETGGLVKFGSSFPNRNGSGNRRAAGALTYMFRLAGSNGRIRRLYIFTFSGGSSGVRFDAGLLDPHGVPRPGYVVVCRKLHASKCSGFKVDTKH